MSAYDFTAAGEFLTDEAETTPEQLLEDVRGAMCMVQDIEYDHGESGVSRDIYTTLLTCADFIERITPHTIAITEP